MNKYLGKTMKILFLGVFLVITVFPLYWIIITSLKPSKDIFSIPLHYWPKNFTFENYLSLFSFSDLHVYIINSLIVAIVSGACTVLISIFSAYVLARYEFKGKGQVITAFFLTQMVPIFIALGPLYMLMSNLHMLNKLPPLMLMYTVMMIPFCTIMLKGFFERIPVSIEEAAIMDGCNRIQAIFKVVFPIMLPGIAATFIFAFVQSWNELFLAIMFIDTDGAKTIPVAMNSFITKFNIDWGSMSAATVISVIPTLLLFAFFQKYIVEGIGEGAVKG